MTMSLIIKENTNNTRLCFSGRECIRSESVTSVTEGLHYQLFTSYANTLIIKRKPHLLTTPTTLSPAPLLCSCLEDEYENECPTCARENRY